MLQMAALFHCMNVGIRFSEFSLLSVSFILKVYENVGFVSDCENPNRCNRSCYRTSLILFYKGIDLFMLFFLKDVAIIFSFTRQNCILRF